ncbi:MAG: ergothioneine biosynthesis protein EgtB [Dehalococcoidia bacterium]|nr:ergothioneine biosynthesis protein EgtB [Dehalococcoidia bacterium]
MDATKHTSPRASSVAERFEAVRAASAALCETLETEDYVIQSMPDVSPTKWHLAHTSWFFETLVLRDAIPDYQAFHPRFQWLFNSYYNSIGPQFERASRGLVSRPTVDETYRYRAHVDQQMRRLFDTSLPGGLAPIVELGLHHEQQHQELMLMDIKHVFWTNPLRPALRDDAAAPSPHEAAPLRWFEYPGGLCQVGYEGDDFAFDNEGPRHRVFLEPFSLASRCVTNAEYAAFIEDGGYDHHDLWLSSGWATVRAEGWRSPLYWEQRDGEWFELTLGGMRPLDPHAPVVHVSYYEADAYARWAGARLPQEAEWEVIAADAPIEGNFVESGLLHPTVAPPPGESPSQLFGDVWEWTSNAYLPYPGYEPPVGAVGEYNGKFMSGQMVLRGGCVATPHDHIRATYRNFFPPYARWPFAGIRLARWTAS